VLRITRLTVTGLCIAGLTAAALTPAAAEPGAEPAAAAPIAVKSAGSANNVGLSPCNNVPAKLTGYGPGDLIASTELDLSGSPITGARAWRILYVSIGVDDRNLEPVCGVVVAPSDPAKVKRNIIGWSHGTMGLNQSCQPSMDPNTYVFGATPNGIGAVKYGSAISGGVSGKPEDGILQGLINDGRVVTVTDYYSGLGSGKGKKQHYALGLPSGANVLDSVRAGIRLVGELPGSLVGGPGTWDLVTWGHSQGGQAELWAGQLARKYFAGTSPRKAPNPSVNLVGVAALAPATSLTAPKGMKLSNKLVGRHLGDFEMHQGAAEAFGGTVGSIGPLLFSLVAKTWDQYGGYKVNKHAKFVGLPGGARPKVTSIVTTKKSAPSKYNGQRAAGIITSNCLLAGQGALTAAKATQPFTNPKKNAFFVQPIWGTKVHGQYVGRFDKTCISTHNSAIKAWCSWMQFNTPGPNGTNKFDKIPKNQAGQPVGVFIAQGMNDNVIHCISPTNGQVPTQKNCLSAQYYASMVPKYCPAGGSVGHLEFNTWQMFKGSLVKAGSPATHMAIPGQAADNGSGGFAGSKLDTFMNNAFAHTLTNGCTAAVAN